MQIHDRSFRDSFWPDVSKADKAHYAVDQGFWVMLFIAGMTAVLAGLGIFPAWGWIQGGLFLVVAVGLRLRSRSAAVVGLLLFILGQCLSIPMDGTQLVVFIVFLFALINAVRGTFGIHKILSSGTPAPDVRMIPKLRKTDSAIFIFVLLLFPLIFFVVLSPEERTSMVNTIRERSGITPSLSTKKGTTEPTIVTLANGTTIALPPEWEVTDSSDTKKTKVMVGLREQDMGGAFFEESKAEISRNFTKEMTLSRYADAVQKSIVRKITNGTSTGPEAFVLRGKSCLRYNVLGVQESFRIRFEATSCDFGKYFLQGVVWAGQADFDSMRAPVQALFDGIQG